MRFLRFLALSVLGALLLASCGATVTVVETASDEVEFVPTRAFLLNSVARVEAAQSFEFEGFMEMQSFLTMGSRTEPVMVGTVANDRSRIDADLSAMMGPIAALGDQAFGDFDPANLRMSTITDADTIYLNAPFFGMTFGQMPPGLLGDDVDFSWIDVVSDGWGQIRIGDVVDVDDLHSDVLSGGMNAEQVLGLLRDVTTVTEAGPSQVRGVDTNVLTASVTLGDLFDANGALDEMPDFEDFEDLMADTLATPIDIEVYIDNNGLLRRVVFEADMGAATGMGMQTWQQVDFFNYGGDLSVELPADAVDITDGFASLLELGAG